MNIEKSKLIDGWMFDSELETIATLASNKKNIIEIGCWKGRSTRAICDNTNGNVFVVDHWKGPIDVEKWDYQEIRDHGSYYVYNMFVNNLKDHIDSGKIKIYVQNSNDAIHYIYQEYGNKYFDMIFIDGDHTYEQARKDILNYLPLVQIGGIISGHDYNWDGVRKAVDECLPGVKLYGNIWCFERKE
jgi:hypothetical protein